LDKFGNPNASVGLAGKGCPAGDQCWAVQIAAKLPPIDKLAQLQQPFMAWSETALGTVGSTTWYKAVSILPFAVPTCAATPSCVTKGILLVDEEELL
jgi:hypothetical protein